MAGRYAFSPWLLLVSAPFLILGFLATEITANDVERWPLYLLVGTLGHLVLVGSILAGRWLLTPQGLSKSSRPGLVLIIYFLASQLRALTFSVGLDALALNNQSPLWVRLITSGALITTTFAFSSYSLESYRQYRDAREDLVRGIVYAQTEIDRQKSVSNSLRESLLGTLDREISEANQITRQKLLDLQAKLEAGVNVAPELQALLDEADGKWRSISHNAWQAARISVPVITTREFFGLLVRNNPMSRVAIVVGGLFLFALGFRGHLELPMALLWAGLWIAVMFALTTLVNFLGSRVTKAGLVFLIVSFLALAGSGALLLAIPGLGGTDGLGAVVIHLLIVATSATVGYGPALIRNRQSILDSLQASLDDATIERLRVESELVLLAQKVASRLHANNRGLFLARVMTLQKALDHGDDEAALRALKDLQESLLNVEPAQPEAPRDSELLSFLDNWRGLVDIHSNLHTVHVPDSLHSAINTLVMDAVNDAVRHGGADWIDITLETHHDRVTLVVTNNGRPPEKRARGIGSRTLDRLATGGWTRETHDVGFTRLRATVFLPVSESATTAAE